MRDWEAAGRETAPVVKIRRLGLSSWLWVIALCLAIAIAAAHFA